MKTIFLVGNPNVGKSSLFSLLTGAQVITANYPGTTVSVKRGTFGCTHPTCGTKKCVCTLVDLPGIYSLDYPEQEAEKVAISLIDSSPNGIVVNVLDATHLERNLYLTLQLCKKHKGPLIIVLTMWDEALCQGININTHLLSHLLGCPVVCVVSPSGFGVFSLTRLLLDHTKEQQMHRSIPERCVRDNEWETIQHIVGAVQKRGKPSLSHLRVRFEMLTLHPVWGSLFACMVLLASFLIVACVGDKLEGGICSLFDIFYAPPLLGLNSLLQNYPLLSKLLIGHTDGNTIAWAEAMGILSSGLYIPLVKVAPVVALFYLLIGILEDTGYLPRIAALSERLSKQFGIQGFAIVPMILGAGCNVTGIMATRLLSTRKERIITAALLSITIPCTSQTAMILSLWPVIGASYVAAIFVILALSWYLLGRLCGLFVKRNTPFLIELPPFRLPHFHLVAKKLRYRLAHFFGDAIPITIMGIGFLFCAQLCGIFDVLATFVAPGAHSLWGLPPSIVPILFMGLFRKEIAMSFLYALHGVSAQQLFITTLLLSFYFPCISVYTTLYKEFGWRGLSLISGAMIVVSTIIGTVASHALRWWF